MSSTNSPSSSDDEPQSKRDVYSFWQFSWSSSNPLDRSSSTDRFRRILMIIALLAYSIDDAYGFYLTVLRSTFFSIQLWLVLGAALLVYKAFCLAVIGDAEGERVVIRSRVVRYLDLCKCNLVFQQADWCFVVGPRTLRCLPSPVRLSCRRFLRRQRLAILGRPRGRLRA